MVASIYFESSEAAAAVDKWHPIDVENLVVVEDAKFSVKEHNKSKKTHLKFQKVIKGQRLMNPKTQLLLFISAKDCDASHQYWTVVWLDSWPIAKHMEMKHFEMIKGKPIHG